MSFPPGLVRRISEDAAREGTTFSGWLTETASRRLKLAAGRRGLAEWEREHGPLTRDELSEAEIRVRALLRRRTGRSRRSA